MTEDERELHPPDALTHAAVVPPNESNTADAAAVESGPVVNRLEELFPLIWLGMLSIVCVVGVYNAVAKLP